MTYHLKYGFRQYYSPRRFLIDFHNKELLTFFLVELKKFCKKRNGLSLRFDPYIPYVQRDLDGNEVEGGYSNKDVFETIISCGYKHHGFTRGIDLTRECRWMYTIPLENYTEKSLLDSFERNARRSIQRTIKYKIYTKKLDETNVDEFIRVALATGARRGFEVRSSNYYKTLLKTFGTRQHVMFLSAVIDLDYYLQLVNDDIANEEKVIDECDEKLTNNPTSSKYLKKKKISQEVLESYKKG